MNESLYQGPVTLIVSSRQHPTFSWVRDATGKMVKGVCAVTIILNVENETKLIQLAFHPKGNPGAVPCAKFDGPVELDRIEFQEDTK